MPLQKILSCLWLAALLGGGLAWWNKGRLPPVKEIRREAWRVPVQKGTEAKAFSFSYRGRPFDVKPLADYEFWGVIVSHNDIDSLADIYHDEDAVDTKDVCVAWGEAAANPEIHKVKFRSGPFTCYFQYPGDVVFQQQHVSNNHLVTDDPGLRERIARLRVGDQIHAKGMLVSYRPADQPDNWRTSSLTRGDTGPGACEVFFARELEVLAQGTPGWYKLWRFCLQGFIAISILKIGLILKGS
jgi:hypothetical protein